MRRIKNIDANGERVKSGERYVFDGAVIMCEPGYKEVGILVFNHSYNAWFFVADNGNYHPAISDYYPRQRKRILKYYTKEPCNNVTTD